MNKCAFIVKTIFQILIYIFELVGVSLTMTFLSHQYIEPILSCMEFIERMMLSYAIYQILVVVILTNINDIEKDSCLSYITVLKLCLVYKTTNNPNLKKDIISKIEFSTKPGVFNTPSIKNAFKKIKDNFDNIPQSEFELELINAENIYESTTLNWKYSFLLRLPIFK